MEPHAASATNLGAALRRGLVLSPAEAVAVAYEAARQVSDGIASRIPADPDELSFDGDRLVNHASGSMDCVTPVASLLDRLLPTDRSQVPAALKTLPDRLKWAAGKQVTNLDDLLKVLRWHLPDDAPAVLRGLAERLDPGAVEAFAWRDTSEPPLLTPVVADAERDTPARARRRPTFAVAALMLLLSGYAGFRFTAERVAHSPGVSEEATDAGESAKAIDSPAPETPPLEPRVKVAIPPALDAQAASAQSRSTPLGLAVEGGVFSPSFSADGSQLYFHQGREAGRLLEASLAGGNRGLEPRAVLDDDAHNFHARPSPDGRWIAFDSDRDGTRAVYVMAPDGRDLRKVSGDGFAVIPSWSPDMKWLAFVKAEASRPRVWNLWLRELSSGAMKRVSAFRSGQVWSASWFPDGRAICYSHDDQLIVTDLATGRHRIFDTPIRGRLTRTPAVSPDGSRIVFQVLGDGVWMLDVATGGMRRILDDGTAEEFAWDPRGRRIAYHSRRDGQWRIWVLTL